MTVLYLFLKSIAHWGAGRYCSSEEWEPEEQRSNHFKVHYMIFHTRQNTIWSHVPFLVFVTSMRKNAHILDSKFVKPLSPSQFSSCTVQIVSPPFMLNKCDGESLHRKLHTFHVVNYIVQCVCSWSSCLCAFGAFLSSVLC